MIKQLLPPTGKRVALRTKTELNEEIRKYTVDSLNACLDSSEPALSERIARLEREWDTERIVETVSGASVVAGSICGFRRSKDCLFLMTGAAGFFLLQHALFGWCPSLSLMRKLGIRTADEINSEKAVLKNLRGDFSPETESADHMLEMAEK